LRNSAISLKNQSFSSPSDWIESRDVSAAESVQIAWSKCGWVVEAGFVVEPHLGRFALKVVVLTLFSVGEEESLGYSVKGLEPLI
jgi:hypothetical protein